MVEHFNIDFERDITKDRVSSYSLEFIQFYSDNLIDYKGLELLGKQFVQGQFFYLAESIKIALKCIVLIFIKD